MSEKQVEMFYLGEDYPGIYFTKREVECLIHLLEGHTLVSAARVMGLSPRTVEFYVKNMRLKMGVNNKTELVKRIRKTDFIKHVSVPTIPVLKEELSVSETESS